ncbi:hypothetical protein EXIGLDRAFT_764294 [Exidia glandulosa HHB12029]|uniref:Uncharacterized protein n=1 Tax=Exidia glandulosa HHB12029 TaxID=1314781 RepID=A0A165LBP2_EXIGL|nr:hypothetical protein EXIGLDRAFT_764294 [Exidia glandulosa HHB12029]
MHPAKHLGLTFDVSAALFSADGLARNEGLPLKITERASVRQVTPFLFLRPLNMSPHMSTVSRGAARRGASSVFTPTTFPRLARRSMSWPSRTDLTARPPQNVDTSLECMLIDVCERLSTLTRCLVTVLALLTPISGIIHVRHSLARYVVSRLLTLMEVPNFVSGLLWSAGQRQTFTHRQGVHLTLIPPASVAPQSDRQ